MKLLKNWYYVIFILLVIWLIVDNIQTRMSESNQKTESSNPFAYLVKKPKIGSPVPDFELSDITRKKYKIQDLNGKPVVINFWATWCPPCKSELPLFQDLKAIHSDDLEILAVNIQESKVTVASFIDKNKYNFPVLLDENGMVTDEFGVFAYPATFFIDKEGIIRSHYVGQLNKELLQKNLETIGIDAW